MKAPSLNRTPTTILSAMAMAAAVHFSPSAVRADITVRRESPARPDSSLRGESTYRGNHDAGRDNRGADRSAAVAAARAIERDARELHSESARAIRYGSRDETTALNRLNDLQRAASDLASACERGHGSDETDRHYRALTAAYDAAHNSWRWLDKVHGARDYTARIERSFITVGGCYARPVILVSWREVRGLSYEIEEAAEHLFDVARAESGGYCDFRTRESRRLALDHLYALRTAARDYQRHLERCGSNPQSSSGDFFRLVRALDCARGAVRAFSHHAGRDLRGVESLVQRVEPFYASCRSIGSPWEDRGFEIEYHTGPRVVGSVR